jgi:hypothetical protein
MTTKPPLQNILQGILHTDRKQTKPRKGRENQTTGEEKARKQKVTLIQLHTIKPLINKENYMTGITTYFLILTLNVNGLNSPIKRHRLAKD